MIIGHLIEVQQLENRRHMIEHCAEKRMARVRVFVGKVAVQLAQESGQLVQLPPSRVALGLQFADQRLIDVRLPTCSSIYNWSGNPRLATGPSRKRLNRQAGEAQPGILASAAMLSRARCNLANLGRFCT